MRASKSHMSKENPEAESLCSQKEPYGKESGFLLVQAYVLRPYYEP